jgi:hypothetical protein
LKDWDEDITAFGGVEVVEVWSAGGVMGAWNAAVHGHGLGIS